MASYTPTGTSVTDYTSTAFKPGDTLNASYTGAVNPIKLPAGVYRLECQGAWGGYGYYADMTSSTTTSYTIITSSNYTSYFSVSNNSYYFTPNTSGHWTATNLGVNSSTATTTWTCASTGIYIIYYYYCSETNYDKFSLTVDGTSVVSNVSNSSGTSSSYSAYLSSGDTIVATYSKDSSQHATNENVYIIIEKQYSSTIYAPSSRTITTGGYPGYSSGILRLVEPTTLYLYAGGMGKYSSSTTKGTTNAGGFNGGGTSYVRYYQSSYSSGGGGGGATDIRIGTDSLYARVIVAGGGGGGAGDNAINAKSGGGLTGNSSITEYQATQTAAGTNGSFGQGANATGNTNYNYGPGGGGGGWYGGGASSSVSDSNSDYRTYNGGGSGYVYTSSTASDYPSGCLLNSNYYLTDASTIQNGSARIVNNMNGCIKITCLPNLTIKTDSNTHSPIKAIYVKTASDTWKGGDIVSEYI